MYLIFMIHVYTRFPPEINASVLQENLKHGLFNYLLYHFKLELATNDFVCSELRDKNSVFK